MSKGGNNGEIVIRGGISTLFQFLARCNQKFLERKRAEFLEGKRAEFLAYFSLA